MKNSLGRKKAWYNGMGTAQVIGTLASKAAVVVDEMAKGNKESARLNYKAFDGMYNEVFPAIASVKEYAAGETYNGWKQAQKELCGMKRKLIEEISMFTGMRL